MQQIIVQRVAMVLVLLLVAAATIFAWAVHDERGAAAADSETTTPETLFAQQCTRCHELTEFVEILRSDGDPATTVLEWIEFLDTHGDTRASDDRAIVRYLLERSRM